MISKSGGARMMAAYSLMQLKRHKLAQLAAKIPYISLCTDPTTEAQLLLRDVREISIFEPYALIAPRVVSTTGKDLPEGFQTAEFLMEHGFPPITPTKGIKDKINLYIDLIRTTMLDKE
jgi:acetyl-CoA carboxylase carboxyl transferase subunit beta